MSLSSHNCLIKYIFNHLYIMSLTKCNHVLHNIIMAARDIIMSWLAVSHHVMLSFHNLTEELVQCQLINKSWKPKDQSLLVLRSFVLSTLDSGDYDISIILWHHKFMLVTYFSTPCLNNEFPRHCHTYSTLYKSLFYNLFILILLY